MGEDSTGATGGDRRRLTVPEAAEALGITVDAVRGRVRRKKLRSEHEDGTVYVWVAVPEGTDRRGQSEASQRPSSDQSERIDELHDRVASLERQLERRADETERLHQIIAGLAQANAEQARTIRAIEAPASEEFAEDAETVEEAPEASSEPRSATGGPQAATQSPQSGGLRGLRRRILGW